MILTVLSAKPTAKNQARCSPGETDPKPMHRTSDGIFFRSVYSFSCPVYNINYSLVTLLVYRKNYCFVKELNSELQDTLFVLHGNQCTC